ncbi:Uncharacterised protein [Acidipropionibacterium jensenii]|uniref:Uncharacterized protein n=1 Tax=Acidipropionibacterium jensenii TaxID=1749 RepID=A0A3S4W8P3_9ACTN|nr:Uncharacterised protein [Acidipropionibacterium jensenii]
MSSKLISICAIQGRIQVGHLFRIGLALLMATLLTAPTPALAVSPSPSPTSTGPNQAQCTASGGVWVIVDLPDAIMAANCAPHPADGIDALSQIGVTATPTSKNLICELQGRPINSCSKDKGFDRKTKEYWAYWHRSTPQAPWIYSERGANNYHPQPGSVEGWRWGAKVQPRWHTSPLIPPAMPPHKNGPLPIFITLGVLILTAIIYWWWRRRETINKR